MAGLLDLSTLQLPGLNGVPGLLTAPPQDGSAIAAQPIAPAPPSAVQAPQPTSILDSIFAPKAPRVATGADRLSLIGATLRDVGSSLRGDDPKAIAQAEAAISAEGSPAAQIVAAKAKGAGKAAAQPTDTSLMYAAAKNLFPNDPKAQFLFATGNQDFLKQISESGYGFHSVTGGDSYGDQAGGMKVAPKLVDNQGQYGTQTDAGYTGTGTAAPSIQQQADQQNAATDAAKAVEDARHNQAAEGIDQQKVGIEGGQLGVAKQHLALDQNHLDFDQRNAAAGRTPGVVMVQSADDIAKLAPGTPFIAVHDPYGIVRHK